MIRKDDVQIRVKVGGGGIVEVGEERELLDGNLVIVEVVGEVEEGGDGGVDVGGGGGEEAEDGLVVFGVKSDAIVVSAEREGFSEGVFSVKSTHFGLGLGVGGEHGGVAVRLGAGKKEGEKESEKNTSRNSDN